MTSKVTIKIAETVLRDLHEHFQESENTNEPLGPSIIPEYGTEKQHASKLNTLFLDQCIPRGRSIPVSHHMRQPFVTPIFKNGDCEDAKNASFHLCGLNKTLRENTLSSNRRVISQ